MQEGQQTPVNEPGWEFKPGETISPNAAPSVATNIPHPVEPSPAAVSAIETSITQQVNQEKPADDPVTPPPIAESLPISQPIPPTTVNTEQKPVLPPTPVVQVSTPQPIAAPEEIPANQDSFSWQAQEFADRNKNANWFVLLAVATIIATIAIYIITKSVFSAVMTILAAVGFGIIASKKPKVATYTLDNQGLSIENKPYAYSMFRSFSVVEEAGKPSIILMPMKRFMPPVEIHFEDADEDMIVSILESILPREERKHDAVDRLMSRLHF